MLGRLPLVLVLLAVVAPVAPGHVAPQEGATLAWNLLDCVFVYGTVQVPAALLEPRLPPGFRPFTVNAATAGRVAAVGFEVDVCREGSGLDGQRAPMTYASTWTPVLPPQEHALAGVAHFVNWDVLVPDADRRDAMVAAGVPARDGAILLSTTPDRLSSGPFRVDYDLDGVAFRFDVAPVRALPNAGGEFAQHTPSGDDGALAFWRTEWATTTHHEGAGTVTLDPESWQAKAFGATVLPARFFFGTWSYTDGVIELPR